MITKTLMQIQSPDFDTYFQIINKGLEVRENQDVHFEPGRTIVAQCGSLITRVLYVKDW